MRRLMTEEFCPIDEIQRMEHELWNLKVKDFEISAYTKRFHELVQLCPEMVPTERKKIEAYIRGLTDNIKGTVIGSKPTSLNEAVRMAHALMEQKAQARIERIAEGNKRKWESSQGGNNGHMARDCKGKAIATGANARPTVTCYDCGEKGHTRNYCPKRRDPQGEEARGRAYVIKDTKKQQGPNVVTGMFLLNNHYATVLFDSGSDKSFEPSYVGALNDTSTQHKARAPAVRECTFAGFMKCNRTVFHGHEGAVELRRWFEKTEMVFGISECAEVRKVKFVAATLQGRALTWWKSQVATRGLEAANQIGWTEMRRLMTEEFCPIEEIQRMEHELWNLKGTVIGSKPTSLNEAVRMAHTLMEQKAQARIERIAEGNKIKWESSQGGNNGNNRNNNRDNTRHNQQNNQRRGNARAMTTVPAEQGGYAGNKPLCNRCGKHHFGYCKVVCNNCGKAGHMARDCKGKAIATGANARPTVTCYDCGEKGHTRNYCPKRKDPQGEQARGRAYVFKDTEKQQGPNVVT
ncbi:putative reverse transcriptase domain-containing protein, partial [Tanacetum coccineum]